MEELLHRAYILANAKSQGGHHINISHLGEWIDGTWIYNKWSVSVSGINYTQVIKKTLKEALKELIIKLEQDTRNHLVYVSKALNNEPWQGNDTNPFGYKLDE